MDLTASTATSANHAHNHFPDFLQRNEERIRRPNVVTPLGEGGAGYATEARVFADDLVVDDSVRFVRENRDRLFFLYWSPVVPHANNERARALGDGAHFPDGEPASCPENRSRRCVKRPTSNSNVQRPTARLTEVAGS